jgi:hypothetical protein
MFYARINKIRIFSNRKGFPGLFNRAEVQIYGLAGKPESTVKLEYPVMELDALRLLYLVYFAWLRA